MITEQEFRNLYRQEFKFLEDDFGFNFTTVQHDWFGAVDIYQNQTTGIEVEMDPRDLRIFITLYRLDDGHLPRYTNLREYDSDITHRFNLNGLLQLRNPSLIPEQGYKFPPGASLNKKDKIFKDAKREFTSDKVRSILSQYAIALQQCANDVLQGNFEIFNELGSRKAKLIEEMKRARRPG
ncbi:MAG: hypothetical protein M3347_17885 [Armatimonadota bacterium]|nr:hypothetical protein [Armatimonadota bacterium]